MGADGDDDRPVIDSLRDCLELLADHGQCVTWQDSVSLEPDLRAIAAAASSDSRAGPAVLVEQIEGYPAGRVALNVHGSFANLAIMLGLPPTTPVRELFGEFAARWGPAPGRLERVPESRAPVHERRIERGVDLYELLPLFRTNAYDGGFYLAKACTVSRDPLHPDRFDKQNVGIYRVQLHGPDRISIMTAASHDLARQIRAAEAADLPLKVAVMIGNHPAVTLFGGTPLGYEESEYEYAAGMFGHPIRLTTAGNGADVLADAEIVIEAELMHGERVVEGPFGEFTGCYTGMCRAPLFTVTAVSSRAQPIFENLVVTSGWGELDTLIGLNTSVAVHEDLRAAFPEVVAVNALYQHGLTAVISVRTRFAGFAKSVAHRALGSPHGLQYLKNVILVDADVDPFDLERVMCSLSTRTRAHDVAVLPGLPLIPLDPSAEIPGMGHRLIIDATRATSPEQGRPSVPLERPDLERFAATMDQLRSTAAAIA